MSDHGLDLNAIKQRMGSHSIFAPSYSPTWLICEGSLIPSIFAEDTSGVDAAYGTVGHELGEIWLNRIKAYVGGAERIQFDKFANIERAIDWCEPKELLDTVVTIIARAQSVEEDRITYGPVEFEIERDAEMFAYVREYVLWCAKLPGDHVIEQRVDLSELMPIPDQGGTADHGAMMPGVLIGTDLKMGRGVQVYAAYIDAMDPAAVINGEFNGNPQVLLYLVGLFLEWDWFYHFEKIVVRICQPRRETFDEWETTREELFKFMDYVKERAAACWKPNAPRTPSIKGCQWCKVRSDCPALLALALDIHGDKMNDIDVEADGTITGVSYTGQQMASVAEKFVSGGNDFDTPINPAKLTTEALEKLRPYKKLMEKYFSDVEDELISRGIAGEPLNLHKIAEGMTHRRFKDHARAVIALRRLGLEVDDLYKEVMLSPAAVEELVHAKLKLSKKASAELIAHLVEKPKGRPTLALLRDKRAALPSSKDAFDDLPIDDDEL